MTIEYLNFSISALVAIVYGIYTIVLFRRKFSDKPIENTKGLLLLFAFVITIADLIFSAMYYSIAAGHISSAFGSSVLDLIVLTVNTTVLCLSLGFYLIATNKL